MEGIVLIDKPKGPTSFDVVARVRRLSGVKRVGHAGTLDPLASGLLIVCLGPYTKLVNVLSASSKWYEAEFVLGKVTATDDAEGTVTAVQDISSITEKDIQGVLAQFVGHIDQRPPQYSAIKVGGERAYRMARRAEEFELAPRRIEISAIELLSYVEGVVRVRVHCSKGTYIRSLARDVGAALGVGAYAANIRRLAIGSFAVDDGLIFENLSKEALASRLCKGTEALQGISSFSLTAWQVDEIRTGRLKKIEIDAPAPVSVATCGNEIIALAEGRDRCMEIMRVF